MFRRDRTCQIIKCNLWNTRLCPHLTIIKKMKTYLKLEGKLGPKLQPQTDQSRPTQPDTNLCIRKETKAIEKREKLIPTKMYKVKALARPESQTSNATMQPPVTTPNVPTISESQKAFTRRYFREQPPTIQKHPNLHWHPMAQSRKDVREFLQVEEGLANPSYHYYIKTPHKNRTTNPRTSHPQCNSSTKSRDMLMGTELLHLQNMEEDWDGEHQKQFNRMFQAHSHSNPRCKTFNTPRPRIIRSPKTSSAPVTDI